MREPHAGAAVDDIGADADVQIVGDGVIDPDAHGPDRLHRARPAEQPIDRIVGVRRPGAEIRRLRQPTPAVT